MRPRNGRGSGGGRVSTMVIAARSWFSFAEYVDLEETSGIRHEFLDGQVWAMSGGSPNHSAIAANVTAMLVNHLRGRPCRVYSSDLRIRARATSLGTYADVTVICGKLDLDPEDRKGHTALNPKLLVEVLSPSTETYDRGEKLAHYQQIPGLEEVMLVAHDRQEVEIVRRQPDGSWSRHIAVAGTSARLDSIECDLLVTEIYRDPLGA
jgi:Uma2 family endonuclease